MNTVNSDKTGRNEVLQLKELLQMGAKPESDEVRAIASRVLVACADKEVMRVLREELLSGESLRRRFVQVALGLLPELIKNDAISGKHAHIRLLAEMAKASKLNEPGRWKCLRMTETYDVMAARQLMLDLVETIKPKKELAKKYTKYARGHMGPDGGLSLVEAALSKARTDAQKAPLNALVPMLHKSAAVREPSRSDDDRRSGEPSATSRNRGGQYGDSKPAVVAEKPKRPKPQEDIGRFLDMLQAEIEEVRNALRQNADMRQELEDAEQSQLDLEALLRKSLGKVGALEASLKARQVELDRARAEIEKSADDLGAVKEQIAAKDREIEETKSRAQQRIAVMRQESAAEVATFKQQLWRKLKPDLLEVIHQVEPAAEDVTPDERILFGKLKGILTTCRELSIARETAGGAEQ